MPALPAYAMANDFAREMSHSAGSTAISGSAGEDRAHAVEPSAAHEAEDRWRLEAWREAKKWKATSRRGANRSIGRKWRRAADLIEKASAWLRELAPDASALGPESQWLRENSRLLRSALQGTRKLPKMIRDFPQVETEQGQKTVRAYAAAAGFLRAAGFVFEERAFLTYFKALQEAAGPFEIRELWALNPIMQLVLLEEIAVSSSEFFGSTEQLRTPQLRTPPKESAARLPKLITSLREIGCAAWKELFEELSQVEQMLRDDPAEAYHRMDFESRNRYGGAVKELAAHSEASEPDVVLRALAMARAARQEWSSDPRVRERRSHVGYYLIDEGKEALKKHIRYRPPFFRQIQDAILNWPEVFYLVSIELVTFAIIAFLLSGLGTAVPFFAAIILLLLPAIESAVGVINQWTTFLVPPRVLAKLDFSKSIPPHSTTMVVVPALLINEEHAQRMVRDLEIRYLANRDPNLHFALLTDSPDSSRPFEDNNELVALCSTLIEGLNHKYEGQGRGSFFLFHRHRVFNASEGAWMGWERKRGKLLDFNDLLRQNSDNFPVKIGDLSILPRIRYVITLDADTQLPRGTAHRLVGTLAHPLNRGVIDPASNAVVEGYGLLQPRVGVSVQSASRSRLASIYSGQTAFDIYTRATSDVYQDLFGEGSFTGKGIYEVDVFQRVLAKRFPCNAILSHDLVEGAYARAGLVSDIEVIDDYPSHFSAYSRRKHRWVRGDWQIMRWLLPRVPDYFGKMASNPLSLISRWKILDNLRRSLTETSTFVLLLAGWFFLPGGPVRWTVAALVLILIPTYLQLLLSLSKAGGAENVRDSLKEAGATFITGQVNVFFTLAFLCHQTLVTVDAIVRTVIRLTVTRKRLLEWETAAQAELGTEKKTPVDVYLRLTPWLSAATAVTLAACRPRALLVALPALVAWACSKTLARWLNRSLPAGKTQITAEDEALLRGAALRTWRFFRQFSNAAANWLVPDNVQQEPPVAAPRISPTNLGLLLDARLAAYELGYLTVAEFASETEKSLARAARLTRHNGHFLNWYDTRTLAPLEPLFVSTVDSGNLAACLWALKQGCLQMSRQPLFRPADWRGIRDHVEVMDELASAGAAPEEAVSAIKRLRERMKSLRDGSAAWIRELPAVERALLELATTLASETTGSGELGWWAAESLERLRQARALIESFAPWLWPADRELLGQLGPEDVEQLTLESLPRVLADLDAKLQRLSEDETTDEAKKLAARALRATLPERLREAEALSQKLAALAEQAGAWVEQMDFRFLYNERRKVLSVGYDVRGERLEASCYELLASEARAAAFVAIAKGDVPQESWLHLGRAHVLVKGERVLLSWSGTMFEYLMPALWMRNYPNTILEQSLRAAVRCQQAAGKKEQRPWGISEAASSQRDAAGHYQYRAFGLPALGIRPAASDDDRVVSPYATFLALAVDAPGAVKNLRHMKEMNWLGAFGFYEAADFTPARVTSLAGHEPVRCWMAHHQGMSLLAVTNLLRDSVIQELFHAEALVAGTERLLDERLPVAVHVEPADEPQRRERKGPCKDGKDQDRAAPLDTLPRAPAAGEAPESRNSRWEDLSAESCGSRRR